MAKSEIKQTSAAFSVDNVSAVVMTPDPVPDLEGNFVREWRFFGPVTGEGTPPLVFVVRATGPTAASLEVAVRPLSL
jgi:hypothetical protein